MTTMKDFERIAFRVGMAALERERQRIRLFSPLLMKDIPFGPEHRHADGCFHLNLDNTEMVMPGKHGKGGKKGGKKGGGKKGGGRKGY